MRTGQARRQRRRGEAGLEAAAGGAQERSRSKSLSTYRRFFLLTRLLIFEAIAATSESLLLLTRCTCACAPVALANEPSLHSTRGASQGTQCTTGRVEIEAELCKNIEHNRSKH